MLVVIIIFGYRYFEKNVFLEWDEVIIIIIF